MFNFGIQATCDGRTLEECKYVFSRIFCSLKSMKNVILQLKLNMYEGMSITTARKI
jgi:hypothetical protein